MRPPLRHLWPGVLIFALPFLSGAMIAPSGHQPAVAVSLMAGGLLGLALFGKPRRSN